MRTALERTEIEWWEANRPPSLSGLTHTHTHTHTQEEKGRKEKRKGKICIYVSQQHDYHTPSGYQLASKQTIPPPSTIPLRPPCPPHIDDKCDM